MILKLPPTTPAKKNLLYIASFGVPHENATRMYFESSHNHIEAVQNAIVLATFRRSNLVAELEDRLARDIAWINTKVKEDYFLLWYCWKMFTS